MPDVTSPASRFREFRERAGLSHEDVAWEIGFSSSCVWDIESYDDELSSCYSPSELQRFARVLNVHPLEFFGAQTSEPAVSAADLVRLIHEHCRSRGVSLEQFEDSVGWHLSERMESPERLLKDISIDGLQWICQELGISCYRVLLSL